MAKNTTPGYLDMAICLIRCMVSKARGLTNPGPNQACGTSKGNKLYGWESTSIFAIRFWDVGNRVGPQNQKLTNRLGDTKFYCLWAYFYHKNGFQPPKKVFRPLGWAPKKPKPQKMANFEIAADLSSGISNNIRRKIQNQ